MIKGEPFKGLNKRGVCSVGEKARIATKILILKTVVIPYQNDEITSTLNMFLHSVVVSLITFFKYIIIS